MGDALREFRGASEDDPLREVDGRGRISLAQIATERRYLVTLQDSGQILLTPAKVIPADHPAAEHIRRAVAGERISGRGRPQRQPE